MEQLSKSTFQNLLNRLTSINDYSEINHMIQELSDREAQALKIAFDTMSKSE